MGSFDQSDGAAGQESAKCARLEKFPEKQLCWWAGYGCGATIDDDQRGVDGIEIGSSCGASSPPCLGSQLVGDTYTPLRYSIHDRDK